MDRLPSRAADLDAAITSLFLDQRLPLVRLAILLTSDRGAAEDLVQDAFVGLTRKLDTLRDRESAAAYLRSATVNNCRSHLRRRAVMRRHPLHLDTELRGDVVLDAVLLTEEHREILSLVEGLSRRQREVIVLRYWANLSEAQIAAELGISPGTVKATASRALARLNKNASQR